MREILFRGKRISGGEWLYGSLLTDNRGQKHIIPFKEIYNGHHVCIESDWPQFFDQQTIGQFTGLVDKHGRKIFEGDIVAKDVFQKRERIDSDGNKLQVFEINKPKIQKTAVVEYCSKRGKFDTGTPEMCFDFASDFYIIGNIHDNPELLT